MYSRSSQTGAAWRFYNLRDWIMPASKGWVQLVVLQGKYTSSTVFRLSSSESLCTLALSLS